MERIKLGDRKSEERRCALCHDALGHNPVISCPGCQTSLHLDCCGQLEQCPTLGCAELLVQEQPQSFDDASLRRPTSSESELRLLLRGLKSSHLGWALIGLIIGLSIGLTARPPTWSNSWWYYHFAGVFAHAVGWALAGLTLREVANRLIEHGRRHSEKDKG